MNAALKASLRVATDHHRTGAPRVLPTITLRAKKPKSSLRKMVTAPVLLCLAFLGSSWWLNHHIISIDLGMPWPPLLPHTWQDLLPVEEAASPLLPEAPITPQAEASPTGASPAAAPLAYAPELPPPSETMTPVPLDQFIAASQPTAPQTGTPETGSPAPETSRLPEVTRIQPASQGQSLPQILPMMPAVQTNADGIMRPIEAIQHPSPETVAPTPNGAPLVPVVAAKVGEPDLPLLTTRPNPPAPPPHIIHIAAPEADQAPLLLNAHAALQQGDMNNALILYDRILAQNGNNHAALEGKAFTLERNGQFDSAVTVNQKILELYPDDAPAQVALIRTLGQSSLPEATTDLSLMEASNPNNATIQAALSKQLVKQGDYEHAAQHLERATAGDPSNRLYRLDLALLYDHMGNKTKAIELYQAVLDTEADPDKTDQLPLSYTTIKQRISYLAMVKP